MEEQVSYRILFRFLKFIIASCDSGACLMASALYVFPLKRPQLTENKRLSLFLFLSLSSMSSLVLWCPSFPECGAMAGSTLRAELRELESKRYEVMKKIEEAMAFLDTTPVGLRGSLVDSEGFPRDDCDLFAVRRARQTVNCGHNDLKSLETTIHEKLIQLHEECREEAEEQMRRDAMKNNKNNMKAAGDGGEHAQLQKEMADKKPFVRIVRVVSGSPAAEAGLTAEDLVVQYGDLDAEKVLAGGYSEMTRVTSSHEGKMMRVWVRSASGEVRELFVVPQKWKGDGLLGCTFEPVQLV
uniref:Putative proteasome 26S non-ATPase subunit 9 n=1 Tax=Trypanosoma congolense (strain IL3000) TaxID=1068625 RepID=G0USG8_TRYCI|nr:putative proteasome 26S non-ATPase subunit 9 [Trypanosoma congolense IL3000]